MLPDALLHLFFRRRWRGFETLHRLFRRPRVRIRSRHGVRFALDPHDYVDAAVLRDGFYETEVFDACRPFFGADAVFWDIGGCFGLHAVTAKTLFPAMAVHVFEPNPAGQHAIRANALLNRARLHLWPLALDSRDGSAELYLPAPGNSGMAGLHPWNPADYAGHETVVTARAQTLVDSGKIPPPTVIKLDVEGGEEAALRGLGRYLHAPALRLLVLECSRAVLDPAAGDPLRALLLHAGFRLRPLVRLEDTGHALVNVAAHRPD